MSRHTPRHIWQERGGEFSYICSCGMHMKHQQFGEWPRCPAEAPLVTDAHRMLAILDEDIKRLPKGI